jgi:demethylsterigmatocystin 6-O-methyltransferase
MHDYSDAVCVQILKQIVPAMAPDSVVLISDFCLPDKITAHDLPAVTMDLTMLNMGGKERSASGFAKILQGAGLELVKIHRPPMGAGAIVEARQP